MVESATVAVFIGSLRKDSFNRKLAQALAEIAAPRLSLRIVEIGHLGPYNQDFDPAPPADWVILKDSIRSSDAVLFITPEYNRSVPGVLKNAIDIASRPYGESAWYGKPGAVITVSPSAIGGFGSNHHLRQSMVFLDVPMLQQPEMYIGGAAKKFDHDGTLKDDSLRKLLDEFVDAFAEWIERISVSEPELRKAS